jgi:NRAMP (natural resistance-associated macrophage protein)-like metal ion transporter
MTESNPATLAPGEVPKQPDRPKLMEVMGPGLITGASDDDPSGIATYSQAGAQFGFALGWTLVLTFPLMCAIQQISANIGRVTGRGLAGNLRRYYPRWLLNLMVALLIVANTINIGADLGAMAAALRLLVAGPLLLYVGAFAVVSVVMEVFLRYSRYVSVLKWLTISLFAYVGTAFVVDMPWRQALVALVVPHPAWGADYFTIVVAIFGTTISPYLFFWQAGEEVEDMNERANSSSLLDDPAAAPRELARIRLDTYLGMGFSNIVAIFIVWTTAATLHAHGVTTINSAAQAAEALRPFAGPFAFTIFALGIIGTGLLAVPVLAGSAAYAIGEARNWPIGLGRRPLKARAFYATIAIATLVGGGMNFIGLDPVRALIWSAVVNGVVAVPIMAMMVLMACRRDVMGGFVLGAWLRGFGWLATAVMAVAAVGMFATWGG